MTGSVFQKWQPAYAEHRIAAFPSEEVGCRPRKRTNGRCASKPPRQLTFLKFNNAGVAARNCPPACMTSNLPEQFTGGNKRNDIH